MTIDAYISKSNKQHGQWKSDGCAVFRDVSRDAAWLGRGLDIKSCVFPDLVAEFTSTDTIECADPTFVIDDNVITTVEVSMQMMYTIGR